MAHKHKAYLLLTLIVIHLGCVGCVMPWKDNRGNGNERVKIRALPLRNVGMQTPKVGLVFFGENVAVNTWSSYLGGNFGDGPASCIRFQ